MNEKYLLYFDDTGSRDPDKSTYAQIARQDSMDCFGLGGVLIREENIDAIFQSYKAFCAEWQID